LTTDCGTPGYKQCKLFKHQRDRPLGHWLPCGNRGLSIEFFYLTVNFLISTTRQNYKKADITIRATSLKSKVHPQFAA
jgi:hypothetical protein